MKRISIIFIALLVLALTVADFNKLIYNQYFYIEELQKSRANTIQINQAIEGLGMLQSIKQRLKDYERTRP